ncbi:MAG: TPM domain-containing protein [Chloroflexota bacterium]
MKRLLSVQAICFLCWMMCSGPLQQALAQPAIPQLSGRVVDHTAILSAETENEVTALLKAHEEATSNQVVVLTIGSLDGVVLEEYSLDVARTWQLGQADKNNGVLLLIAYVDRKIRIEVGYGLEGDLPDIKAKRIIDGDITPYFRNQDFDGGVRNGVMAILGTIEGTYEPAETSDNLSDAPLFFRLIFGMMFVGMPIFVLYGTVFQVGCQRWFMLFFFMPFLAVGGTVLLPPYGGVILAVGVFIAYLWFQWHISRYPKWAAYREAMEKAKRTGNAVPVVIGGRTFQVGGRPSSSSGSSGGGGFSGGGGSFGGGGASGGW